MNDISEGMYAALIANLRRWALSASRALTSIEYRHEF